MNVIRRNSCPAKRFHCDYIFPSRRKGRLTKHNSCNKPRVMSGNCLNSNNKNTGYIKSKKHRRCVKWWDFWNEFHSSARGHVRFCTRHVTAITQFASNCSHFSFPFFVHFFFLSFFFSFNYLACFFSVMYLLSTKEVSFWFIFGRCLLRILAWTQTILTQVFSRFSSFPSDKFWESAFCPFPSTFFPVHKSVCILTVSFHVLSSSLIIIIESFNDIRLCQRHKSQSTNFPSLYFTFFCPFLLL